jgi:hypothetical protein
MFLTVLEFGRSRERASGGFALDAPAGAIKPCEPGLRPLDGELPTQADRSLTPLDDRADEYEHHARTDEWHPYCHPSVSGFELCQGEYHTSQQNQASANL